MRGTNVLIGVTSLLIFAPNASQGQAPEKLEFEVASVRRGDNGGRGGGIRGGPGKQDAELFAATNIPLRFLLEAAFNLWPDQLSAPAWLETEKYTIVAKVPPGTTKDQFQAMYQNLLVERFKITFHRVMKSFIAYEMTVSKTGLRLKPSAVDLNFPNLHNYDVLTGSKADKDGFPILPDGNFKFTTGLRSEGKDRQTWRGWSIAEIATLIENRTRIRIVDKTDLTGLYDFRVQFGISPAPTAAGQAPSEPFDPIEDTLSAVHSQLGLKLEKTTASRDVIVIDSAEKMPTED